MVNLTTCLSGLIETHQQIVISVLNIPLSLTAFLANLLIIIALHKPSPLHPPSKLLLGCLATTNLCVGLIAQPLFVIYLMSSEHYKRCYYVQLILDVAGAIFVGVSVLTVTAMSVDRLLAVMLGLRYRQVVTLRRVWVLVASFWLCSTLILALVFYKADIFITFICIALLLCLIFSSCCYSKIYLILRQHQAQVQDHVLQGQVNGEIPINIARYKKTVSSVLWVQTIFLVSYAPLGLIGAILVITGLEAPSLYLASYVTYSLVLLNASINRINPFLYCWKMREVRQAVKDTIRGFFC